MIPPRHSEVLPVNPEFVKLGLDGSTIAVLSILNKKDHQEGDDGRSHIDELTGTRAR
jgi:hypothetical protein